MKDYEFYYTQDGSIGLYSHTDEDVYHSKFGALTEAWEKFIIPSGLDKIINTKEQINVLDVCYGVGYNTKALMSFVINTDEKFLVKKNIFNNYLEKFKTKIPDSNVSIAPIDNDKILKKNDIPKNIEPIDNNKQLTRFSIDCLEINDELVKISPLLKTVITPQEIFSKIVPKIFDCFDTYWIIRDKLSKFTLKVALRNRKSVTELLNLKYNNDYDLLQNKYKINKYVNYIIINSLLDKYKNNYLNKNIRKILKGSKFHGFISKSMLRYALNKQNFKYNFISRFNLIAFLHNIYYNHLSIRYKNIKFKDVESLFKLSFWMDDARKSILTINKQYDLIFLDAFTYSKAPELWTVEFIAELYKRLSPTGILITYSTSAIVRNTFLENNFYLGKIVDEKTGKAIGTIAAKEKTMIKTHLNNYEIGLCNTRAGIPYHDPNLNYSREEILSRREYNFRTSDLLTSTQYMRSRISKNEDSGNNE